MLGTAVADAAALHELAFYLLIAAVPAAAVAALSALGDLLDGSGGSRLARVHVVLSGLALLWIVVAAAVRSAAVDGSVSPAAFSALAVCLAVFAIQGAAALAAAAEGQKGENGSDAAASRA